VGHGLLALNYNELVMETTVNAVTLFSWILRTGYSLGRVYKILESQLCDPQIKDLRSLIPIKTMRHTKRGNGRRRYSQF